MGDATGTYPNVPGDGQGHGTHTTGTMVGDDGSTNQIGMAPGAQTIHCKNLTDRGSGSDATITECLQWDLASWDLNGEFVNSQDIEGRKAQVRTHHHETVDDFPLAVEFFDEDHLYHAQLLKSKRSRYLHPAPLT